MKRLAAMPQKLGRKAVGLIHQAVGRARNTSPWQSETPTTAIYFANVFHDLIDRPGQLRGISRLEPNAFRVNGQRESTVVFRYASPSLLRSLQNRRSGRVLYVLDDNVAAGAADDALPIDYRSRLLRFHQKFVKPMCATADEVIAPSQHILDALDVQNSSLILPALIHDLPNLEHHTSKDVRIVFNGTRSHLSDFRMIVPVLEQLLKKYPFVSLTTFLGTHAPSSLRGERVEHLAPMRWEDYRRFMRQNRFHIALGPAKETPFNLARSPSRILDNAGFGAVGVYSARRPFSKWVAHGETGLLIADGESHWMAGLEQLINDAPARQSIARAAALHAADIGCNSKQKEFWAEKLGIHLHK
jgi:hypothetical protein